MIEKIANPGFFRIGKKSYMKTSKVSLWYFLWKVLTSTSKCAVIFVFDHGFQLFLQISFNNNNKLIIWLQECFHIVQNASTLPIWEPPFFYSICKFFSISRQVFASMISVIMVNPWVIRALSSLKLKLDFEKPWSWRKPKGWSPMGICLMRVGALAFVRPFSEKFHPKRCGNF